MQVDLDKANVEVWRTFVVSSATVPAAVALLLVGLIVVPPTRRRLLGIVKAIPIELSFGEESRDMIAKYSDILSSSRLDIDEALEMRGGEARVIAGEGSALPRLKEAADHAVFLVSDRSVIPPRRELRVVKEAVDPEMDIVRLSKLVIAYSEASGLRALGVMVCDKATDEMLVAVKGLHGTEVVLMTKGRLSEV